MNFYVYLIVLLSVSCIRTKSIVEIDSIENKNNDFILRTFTGHTDNVYNLKVLSNGLLASCSKDRTIKIWNSTTGHTIHTLRGHTSDVMDVNQLDDGTLVSVSKDYRIIRWDVVEGNELNRGFYDISEYPYSFNNPWNPYSGSLYSLEVFDSNHVFAGSEGGSIIKFNAPQDPNQPLKEVAKRNGARSETARIKLLNNGDLILGKGYGVIEIYNSRTLNLKDSFRVHGSSVNDFALLDNGFLFSCSSDARIKRWDTVGYIEYNEIDTGSSCYKLQKLPNNHLASAHFDGTVKIWNMNNYNLVETLAGHKSRATALELLKDGNLVSASYDRTIIVWNLKKILNF